MKFDLKGIRRSNEEDFEKSWLKGAELLSGQKGIFEKLSKLKPEPHPVTQIMEQLRQSFLQAGFREVILPVILEDDHVWRQYGPEAPVILDRCYYLAALPRPDIGLSNEKIELIHKIAPEFKKFEGLKDMLRRYKKGEIEGDDFVDEMCKIGFKPEEATKTIGSVFPEFKSLKPMPTELTLRSHMTSSWFPVIEAMKNQSKPLALFTVGLRFRREQKEDTGHLRAHHGASCIVADPDVSLEDGKKLVEKILRPLGFKEFKFVTKKATSKYYTPGLEVEAYALHGDKWLEIADFGLYSPASLANYNIDFPVMNLGIGVERVTMILTGAKDIRTLEYPHLQSFELSDEELAKSVYFEETPQTEVGKKVAEIAYKAAVEHANDIGVCSTVIWEGKVNGKKMKLEIYEHDEGKALMHPGALNEIWISDGSVVGFKRSEGKGVNTGITYLKAIAQLVGVKVERGEPFDLQVKVVKNPGDINIGINDAARSFITSHNRKIDVKGPVFLDYRFTNM